MSDRGMNIRLLLGLGLGGAVIFWLEYGIGVSIACPFKTLTGIPCPGCGGMRSLDALLHGEFLRALSINPFSVALIGAIGIVGIWLLSDIVRGTTTCIQTLRRLNNRYVLWPTIALLIAIWCRNILCGI